MLISAEDHGTWLPFVSNVVRVRASGRPPELIEEIVLHCAAKLSLEIAPRYSPERGEFEDFVSRAVKNDVVDYLREIDTWRDAESPAPRDAFFRLPVADYSGITVKTLHSQHAQWEFERAAIWSTISGSPCDAAMSRGAIAEQDLERVKYVLTPKENSVYHYRFQVGLSQEDTGKALHITRSAVLKRENYLKAKLEKAGLWVPKRSDSGVSLAESRAVKTPVRIPVRSLSPRPDVFLEKKPQRRRFLEAIRQCRQAFVDHIGPNRVARERYNAAAKANRDRLACSLRGAVTVSKRAA